MIERVACLISREEDLHRNQAAEAQLMETLPAATALLVMYTAPKAVSLGLLEDTAEAVRAETLRADGGQLSRRLSGGGCRYLDGGTLCYSLLLPREDFRVELGQAAAAEAVRRLGVSAAAGPRGSLLAFGRVVGEASFLKRGNAGAQQGVIYADTDPGQAALYLTAGVPVAPLSAFRPGITAEDAMGAFSSVLAEGFRAEPVWLDECLLDGRSLKDSADRFRAEKWVCRSAPENCYRVEERFPWGKAAICLETQNSVISRAQIFTDALETALIDVLARSLWGCPFLIGAIEKRFSQVVAGTRDPRLLQVTGDLFTFLRGALRQSHREGGENLPR